MPGEGLRRVVLGSIIAIAAGVSVGDDVVTAPDVRRGSRTLEIDLPDALGPATLHVPRIPASGVALLLYDTDAASLTSVIDRLAASTLVVPIPAAGLNETGAPPCARVVERLTHASRRAQREAGLTSYRPPVLVGIGRAAGLARDVVHATDPGLFRAGAGTSVLTDGPGCTAARRASVPGRWTTAEASALPDAAANALIHPVPQPSTGHEPLDRWLAHFRLPLAAAWATRPRAVLVLMSDAGGLRPADDDLADALMAADISVLSIDALRYFWQRRSPRDVAFELKRLLGALESLEVPVLAGGTGVGAETMAVAMRHVDELSLDGLVLINPGPSAFFEVEPPLPALVPLIRRDWSTADAVEALAVPTVCLADGPARARAVCDDLARTSRARFVPTAPSTAALVEQVEFLLQALSRESRGRAPDDSPRGGRARAPATW